MEIFIATSIKSFDLNPTHPGPLPRVSFTPGQLNKSNAAKAKRREGARAARPTKWATNCKNRRAANKTNWQAASNMLQGQRVAASFCAQGARKLRPLRNAS